MPPSSSKADRSSHLETTGFVAVELEERAIRKILKPALATALEMIPCQQVTTGEYFTSIDKIRSALLVGLQRSRSIGTWPYLRRIQATGDNCAKRRWGTRSSGKSLNIWNFFPPTTFLAEDLAEEQVLQSVAAKRVKHGGFVGLFIVYASAGHYRLAAIDSFGLVYKWEGRFLGYFRTPVLIDSLKAYRASQVVAYCSTFVVLDNGRVHNFGNFQEWSRDQEQSRSFTIKGHKIQSIASSFDHGVMVTMRRAIFGFGCNNDYQLGVEPYSDLDAIMTTN